MTVERRGEGESEEAAQGGNGRGGASEQSIDERAN